MEKYKASNAIPNRIPSFLNISNQESDTMELNFDMQSSSNYTIDPSGDILSDKYVIMGVILFFVVLFIIAVLVQVFKSYKDSCCKNNEDNPYAYLSSNQEDDDDSLDDIVDDQLNNLYTSCHLMVDDTEVNTSATCVDIVQEDCDFEYDCSSLDNSVLGLESDLSVSGDYDRTKSLTSQNDRKTSLSSQISSKIASIVRLK